MILSRRMRFYLGGWAALMVLIRATGIHRAAPGTAPHFHTQLTGALILAHLIVLSVWGGMMLHEYFDRTNKPDAGVPKP